VDVLAVKAEAGNVKLHRFSVTGGLASLPRQDDARARLSLRGLTTSLRDAGLLDPLVDCLVELV
jgi:hypothetical protein